MSNRFNQLHWPLIIGMGAFAMLHPLLNITGITDLLGRPFAPLMTNVLISAAWLALVVLLRVRQPVLTLTCTGVVAGIFAFALGSILSPLLTGRPLIPFGNLFVLPFAVAGILVTNTLWGLAMGLVARVIQQALPTAEPQGHDEEIAQG